MVTPAGKRVAVAHLKTNHEMSKRWACQVIGCQRITVRYRSRRPDDPALRERLRALARERRRFGYRRLLIFLRREAVPLIPNDRWSLDFVSDQLASGRRFRILAIFDDKIFIA